MPDAPEENSSASAEAQSAVQHLTVLPHSGKVERLAEQPPVPTITPPPPMHASSPDFSTAQKAIESAVVEVCRTVFDPEIPVNVYDLGLIYRIDIDAENHVTVTMTLTSPACPVAGSLPGEVERRIEAIAQVKSADVVLVWDPPWDKSRLSESAMLDLGLF